MTSSDHERPEWLFDEIRHAGVDYSDPRIAEEYDAHHTRFRDYEKDARLISEKHSDFPRTITYVCVR